MAKNSNISKLVDLLRKCDIAPNIATERIAPAISYNTSYRLAIIAIVFGILAESENNDKKIRYHNLMLFQFVLIHPHLIPDLMSWHYANKNKCHDPLAAIWSFPNSFTADSAFSKLFTYCIATNNLRQSSDFIFADHNSFFEKTFEYIVSQGLFCNVIEFAHQLKQIKISKKAIY